MGKWHQRPKEQGEEAAELGGMRFLLKASWSFLERRKAENRRDRKHQMGTQWMGDECQRTSVLWSTREARGIWAKNKQ